MIYLANTLRLCALTGGLLVMVSTAVSAEEQALHPFMSKGGPADPAVLENMPASQPAQNKQATSQRQERIVNPDKPKERYREHITTEDKSSKHQDSSLFTQVNTKKEQVIDRPLNIFGTFTAPATPAPAPQPTQENTTSTASAEGNNKTKSVFTEVNTPSEATRDRPINLF